MKPFSQFREEAAAKVFLQIAEKEMTSAQMKKREEIAQSMDDEDFKERYGKDWMSVKMATATKQAMKEEPDFEVEEVYTEHWCAKHVYHDVFGEGVVLEGEHAVPDEDGNIEWYTVEFPHGKETVFTEDVEIMHERMHGHMMKKKKKMSEEAEELDEISVELMKRAKEKLGGRAMGAHYDDNKRMAREYATRALNMGKRIRRKEYQAAQSTKTEAKLHPNQQQLDVHEPEKDELTAKDFEMLRKSKKARK